MVSEVDHNGRKLDFLPAQGKKGEEGKSQLFIFNEERFFFPSWCRPKKEKESKETAAEIGGDREKVEAQI